MNAGATKTTNEVDEAFLRLCEALGIQASALAYLEIPAILRAVEARGENRIRESVTNAQHNETTEKEAYRDGYEAFGRRDTNNPHQFGIAECVAWEAGWNFAHLMSKDDKTDVIDA